jgi:hypothetical protein
MESVKAWNDLTAGLRRNNYCRRPGSCEEAFEVVGDELPRSGMERANERGKWVVPFQGGE